MQRNNHVNNESNNSQDAEQNRPSHCKRTCRDLDMIADDFRNIGSDNRESAANLGLWCYLTNDEVGESDDPCSQLFCCLACGCALCCCCAVTTARVAVAVICPSEYPAQPALEEQEPRQLHNQDRPVSNNRNDNYRL